MSAFDLLLKVKFKLLWLFFSNPEIALFLESSTTKISEYLWLYCQKRPEPDQSGGRQGLMWLVQKGTWLTFIFGLSAQNATSYTEKYALRAQRPCFQAAPSLPPATETRHRSCSTWMHLPVSLPSLGTMFLTMNASQEPGVKTSFQGWRMSLAEESLGCHFCRALASLLRMGE